ncbi:MAG: hypothetical protein KGL26_15990 [Pseudomonadota bacterium]|nr:hypothetical protein [Pseudomonadota bacterium]
MLAITILIFATGLAANIASYLHVDRLTPSVPGVYILGIFLVFFPAVLAAIRIGREVPQRKSWQVIWANSPSWVKQGQYVLFTYFFLSLLMFGNAGQGSTTNVRILTAAVMMFSYVAGAIFYAAYSSPELLFPHYCKNGHRISPLDKYCPQCGVPT